MSGKCFLFAAAAVLFLIGLVLGFFGFVYVTASSAPGAASGELGTGIGLAIAAVVFLGGGAGLVYAAMRGQKTEVVQQVTMNVDLPGDTKVSPLTCRNCGGALKPENVKMVSGAPMVQCPYCGTTYQLTEEPKW